MTSIQRTLASLGALLSSADKARRRREAEAKRLVRQGRGK